MMEISLNSQWNRIMDCAVSHNRKIIISACDDFTLKIWDVESGFKEIKTLIGHSAPVRSCALSGDGHILLSSSSDRALMIWDMDNFRQIYEKKDAHDTRIFTVSVTADGKTVVSASEEGTIKIWSIENQELVLKQELRNVHHGRISDSAIDASAKFLVTGGEDGVLIVWDLNTYQPYQKFHLHEGRVIGCTITSDAELIASVSADSHVNILRFDHKKNEFRSYSADVLDSLELRCCSINAAKTKILIGLEKGIFRVYKLTEGKLELVKECFGHDDTIRWCYYSDALDAIFTAGEDARIKIWNANSFELVKVLYGHSGPIQTQIYIKNSGQIIYTLGDGTLYSYDLATRKFHVKPVCLNQRITSILEFDANIIVATEAGNLYSFDMQLSKIKGPTCVSESALKSLYLCGDNLLAAGTADGKLLKLGPSLSKVELLHEFTDCGIMHLAGCKGAAADEMIIICSEDGRLFFFNLNTRLIKEVKLGHGPLWFAAVSNDEKRLAVFSEKSTLFLLDLSTFKYDVMNFDNSKSLTSGSFSNCGKYLLSTSFDGVIRVIDLEINTVVAEFRAEGAMHHGVWLDEKLTASCLGNYGRYLLNLIESQS